MVTVANFTSDLEQIRCVAGFRGTNRKITSFSIIDTPEILEGNLSWTPGILRFIIRPY